MKPHEAAALLKIGASTIRAWTIGEYRQYFSPTAQGGDGRPRQLTDTDLHILHYINTMKQAGMGADSIHASLRQLQARNWDGLPSLPDAPPNVANVPVIPAAAADAALTAHTQSLMREIEMWKERVNDLQERLDDKDTQFVEAERRLAAALAELELWRAGRLKPE